MIAPHGTPSPHQQGGLEGPAALAATTSRVRQRLWIGGAHAPLPDEVTVVISLDDHAPPITAPDITEIREPFPDSRWQPIDTDAVTAAIHAAATRPDTGVLVRCRHGINRSALIAALLLVTDGQEPDDAIDSIRTARPGALTNPYFTDLIHTWPDDPMQTAR